jgi:hypothetical protein
MKKLFVGILMGIFLVFMLSSVIAQSGVEGTSCERKTPTPGGGCDSVPSGSDCADYYGLLNGLYWHCVSFPGGCAAGSQCSNLDCTGGHLVTGCTVAYYSPDGNSCSYYYELNSEQNLYNQCRPSPSGGYCDNHEQLYYCGKPLPPLNPENNTVPEFGTSAIIAVIAIAVIGAFLIVRKK